MPAFTPATLRTLLVGDEPAQRLRASQALLALVVYLVFAAVQHTEVLLGLIDAADSWRLSAFNIGGGLLFYGLVRSGLNLRLKRERALTVPQMLWAMVGIAWSYAITGPARGAVLLIMMLVILFGMFALTPAKARALAATGFGLLGAVMVWKAASGAYDARVEGLHLCFAGIVMAAAAMLSIRLGALRSRLEAQRAELKQALARIQALATHDELTGLLNRRAVLERLQLELRAGDRALPRLAVALIDLDHFKRINDSFGHAAGDQVLRRFAELAHDELRGGDVVARWGGEEFLVMMPGADVEQALRGLERLRSRLRRSPLAEVEAGLVIGFSAGVALCGDIDDLEPAIERADAAMYRAKQAGRDRALAAA